MTEEKMEEIYNSTFDLDTLITSIEPNKINKLIQEHFLQITPENKKASVENESVDTSSSQTEEVEDNEKEDSKDSSTSTNEESTNQTHELNKLDEKREDVLKTQESLKTESPDEIQKKIDDLLEGI
jgi:DNA-directed RNA polymerase alpha subunit